MFLTKVLYIRIFRCIGHLIKELINIFLSPSDPTSILTSRPTSDSTIRSDIRFDIRFDIQSDIRSDIQSDILSDVQSVIPSDIQSNIQSDINWYIGINEWLLLCRLIVDLWVGGDTFKQKYLWSCLAKVKGRLK